MSELIDEYIATYNSVCDKIENNFTNYDSFSISINDFEDDFHNKLAAYHICNEINKAYSRTRIRARMSTTNIGLIIYKIRPQFNITRIINKIVLYYDMVRKNSAA